MLRTVMPRSGQAHPVDDAWRARVEAELKKRGWSQADLAREIGAARSVISNLLSGLVKQSPYVPDIHAALGWTPPQGALANPETDELLALWARLDAMSRGRLLERGKSLVEDTASRKPPDDDVPTPPKKR
jgi:transcriptional regulator with XRE-family HTH domain